MKNNGKYGIKSRGSSYKKRNKGCDDITKQNHWRIIVKEFRNKN